MYIPKEIPNWSGKRPEFKHVKEFQNLRDACQALNNAWQEKRARGEIPQDRDWIVIRIMFEYYALLVAIDSVLKSSYGDMLIAKITYVNISDELAGAFESILEFIAKPAKDK